MSQAQTALEDQETALHASEERVHAIQSALQQGEQRKEFLLHQEQRAADRASAAQTELAAVEGRRSAVQNEVEGLARTNPPESDPTGRGRKRCSAVTNRTAPACKTPL